MIYKEHTYKHVKGAKKKVNEVLKKYGYKPGIIKQVNPQTQLQKYIVIEPKNLMRIDK